MSKQKSAPLEVRRTFAIRASGKVAEDDRTVSVLAATETPVLRTPWYGDPFYEVLLCGPENVDMEFFASGRAPVCLDHDLRSQVGVVERAALEGRELRADLRFSRNPRGEQELVDVRDGIRQNVSISYRIDEVQLVPGSVIGAPDTLKVTRWRPMELGTVAIPADEASGVGRGSGEFPSEMFAAIRARAAEAPNSTVSVVDSLRENSTTAPAAPSPGDERSMKLESQTDSTAASAASAAPGQPAAPAAASVEVRENELREAERARSAEILAIGDAHNLRTEARDAVAKGTPAREFAILALRNIEQRQQAASRTPVIDLSNRERQRYSVANAARAVCGQTWATERTLEREVHDELSKRYGRPVQDSRISILVPPEFMQRAPSLAGNAGTSMSGTGGPLVPSSQAEVQPFLTQRLAAVRAGVTVLDGLRGELVFPTGDTYPASTTPGENASVTPAGTTFTAKRATAKPIRAGTNFSRTLLHNSVPSVDSLLEKVIQTSISEKLEQQIFYGTGSGGQLSGIDDQLSDASISDVDFPSTFLPTYQAFLDMVTAIDNDQALLGPGAFITTRGVVHKSLATNRLGSSSAVAIMSAAAGSQDQWQIDGYPVFTAHAVKRNNASPSSPSQLIAHSAYFGVWSLAYLCLFGPAMEILVDPFGDAANGNIIFWIYQDADFVMPIPKVARRANNILIA